MSLLYLKLLGRPEISLDGKPIQINSDKAKALLFYLAINDRKFSRLHLASLLWGDKPDRQALSSLRGRGGLWKLRAELPDFFPPGMESELGIVQSESETCTTDANRLWQAVSNLPHLTLGECEAVAALYDGELLQGFHIYKGGDGARDFHTWLQFKREEYRQLTTQLFEHMLTLYQEMADVGQVLNVYGRLLNTTFNVTETTYQLSDWLSKNKHTSDLRRLLELYKRAGVDAEDRVIAYVEQQLQTALKDNPFFVGETNQHLIPRNHILDKIKAEMSKPSGKRLFALVGMGGVGKTTTAQWLTTELQDFFQDGILWGDLGKQDIEEIVERWGKFFGDQIQPSFEAQAARIQSLLQRKQVLTILDDMWEEWGIRPIRPKPPTTWLMIITTRSTEVADNIGAEICPVIEFSLDDSLKLLRNVVGAAQIEHDLDAAEQICELLGHLPLALKLIGRRISRATRPLSKWVIKLQQHRLGQLKRPGQSLTEVFNLSWNDLEPIQQQVFAALGIFNGQPVGREVVAAVTRLSAEETWDALEQLVSLSLVRYVSTEYYDQHILLAEFALTKTPDSTLLEHRLVDYYHFELANLPTDIDDLRFEWGNFLTVIKFAHKHKRWQTILDLSMGLTDRWFRGTRYSDARRAYELAFEAAQHLGDRAAQAEIAYQWGCAALEQRRYSLAISQFAQAFEAYAASRNSIGMGRVEDRLARLDMLQGRWESADARLTRAWQQYQQEDDIDGMAAALFGRADLAYHMGDYAAARQFAQGVLGLKEHLADQLNTCKSWRMLSMIESAENNLDAAYRHAMEASRLAMLLNDQAEQSTIVYNLANLLRKQGKLSEAREHAGRALILFQEMGDRIAEANCLNVTALIEIDWQEQQPADARDYRVALQACDDGWSICQDLHYQLGQGVVLLTRGRILQRQSQIEAACRAWQAADQIADELKQVPLKRTLIRLQQRHCS